MPSASCYNPINTGFELFHQNLLTNISHIPENVLSLLKTKIQNDSDDHRQFKIYPKMFKSFNSEQFVKIYYDPTKRIEGKIKRRVRKIKSKVGKDEYSKIYPTGSSPGKFYGNAKMYKLPKNGNINNLPLRTII